MFDGYGDRDQQSESVSAPHQDPDPPRRTKAPLVWWTVAILAILVLGIALLVEALSKA